MALDRVRNRAYAEALSRVITPDSVVLDLGAGVGIHGLIAARLGARRVYLVEPEDVISVADEAARANNLQEVVRCLHGRLEDVTIPERVDVIISVFTGNMLLNEDLLPVLLRARDTYLKPGGILLPDRATIELAPVTAPALHAREIESWSEPQHEVTLAPARAYAANTVFYGWDRADVSYLAEPNSLHAVDLATDAYDALHSETAFTIRTAGVCHGLAGWFTMRLGDRWVSTAPVAERMHWSPAFLPLDPPIPLAEGDTLSVRIDRAPYGDWTWRVASPHGSQRHSTLLSAPLKASTLRKAALDYTPVPNEEGQAVQFILAQCTGATRVSEMAAQVRSRWPARYPTDDDATRFVQRIVKAFT